MKKIISMALAVCLVIGVMLALASCGGGIQNGTYTADGLQGYDAAEFKVNGDKMVYTYDYDDLKIDFTFSYEVKEDKITVNYDGNSYDGDSIVTKGILLGVETVFKAALVGEKSFESGDGYFKIGVVKFVKK